MDRTTPIHTASDETVDECIDALRSERDYWGAKMDGAARAALRSMAYSDTEYTLANLMDVFEETEYRRQILEHETQPTDTEAQKRDPDTLAGAEEVLVRRLAGTDTTTAR